MTMLSFLLALVSAFLVGLVVASGVHLRLRLRERLGRRTPVVDDQAIRKILEEGVITAEDDPPLDLDEINEEERRFWTEPWDEPEEW
ncbi:MAG: hypothetical protein P8170_02245 [Gemmatimonadota bacterium]|jgi:hypothetical protein